MRKLKRWWRQFWGEIRIARRRKEIQALLRSFLNLPAEPVLTARGDRGQDSIYLISEDGTNTLGVLRLLNPWRERKNLAPWEPFYPEKGKARIDREWQAYQKGAPLGLTPQPLWRAEDALACIYLPYRSLRDRLTETPEKSWEFICLAAKRVEDLHRAGLVHMDASLANMLADESMKNIILIDFEYSPKPHITQPMQRLYDHLRLLESSWKFIPPTLRSSSGPWFDIFDGCLDAEMKNVEFSPLAPALQQILTDPVISVPLRQRLPSI